MSRCPACRRAVEGASAYCPHCGASIRSASQTASANHDTLDDLDFAPTELPSETALPSLEPGAVIANRYAVLALLGNGGMGRVYRVHDRLLDQECALKVLHPHLSSDETASERLFREARIGLQLNHPNIVRVRDVGVDGALRFLSMELLPGTTLRGLIGEPGSTSRPLPVEDVFAIALELLDALAYAHRMTVHRDIKPENVFVTGRAAGWPTVKLVDFGIAVERERGRLTSEGRGPGSALYMAPEQRSGDRPPDPAADLYSLGVMLYEMLTGGLPMGRVLPPSHRRAGLDPAWDDFVMSLLEENPADRPASAESAAASLRGLGTTRPEASKPKTVPQFPPTALTASTMTAGAGANTASVRSRRPLTLAIAAAGVVVMAFAVWLVAGRPGVSTATTSSPRWGPGTAPAELREFTFGGVRFVLHWVPTGIFRMGSPVGEPCRRDNEPVSQTAIRSGFWLAETEVTRAQWEAVLGTKPSLKQGTSDYPVDSVSWDDVQSFLGVLNESVEGAGFRLPSEVEWEYAARAGSEQPFSVPCPEFGPNSCRSNLACLDSIAWYAGNSGGRPRPAGDLQANAFGLKDMHGNVWELCSDAPPSNTQSADDRIARGGGWPSQVADLRSARRQPLGRGERLDSTGFRIAREP